MHNLSNLFTVAHGPVIEMRLQVNLRSLGVLFTITLLAPLFMSRAYGQGWQTVDSLDPGSEAVGVACDSGGRIYVAGNAGPNAVVRMSADGGDTWATVDELSGPLVFSICTDTHDTIFVSQLQGEGSIRRSS